MSHLSKEIETEDFEISSFFKPNNETYLTEVKQINLIKLITIGETVFIPTINKRFLLFIVSLTLPLYNL